MSEENIRYTQAGMLIRKPPAEVFNAFIDPEKTRNFWFTKSSGQMEPGIVLTWEWEMYRVSAKVTVKDIRTNEKIVFEWGEPVLTVEINFSTQKDNSTYVTIKESGYKKEGNDLLTAIKDSTGGFTTVLDGLKAFLEHGINLNLIGDKFGNS